MRWGRLQRKLGKPLDQEQCLLLRFREIGKWGVEETTFAHCLLIEVLWFVKIEHPSLGFQRKLGVLQ